MDIKSESQRFLLGQDLMITNIVADEKYNLVVTTGSFNLSQFTKKNKH